jgi:hypothetical protein
MSGDGGTSSLEDLLKREGLADQVGPDFGPRVLELICTLTRMNAWDWLSHRLSDSDRELLADLVEAHNHRLEQGKTPPRTYWVFFSRWWRHQ